MSDISHTARACVPEGLLSQEELTAVQQSDMQPAETDSQWIFPGLQFTCRNNLTGWIFTETSEDVICPTLELWNDFTTTIITTDYRLGLTLTPQNFTEPTSISGFVYSCTLHTAIVVDAGAIIGFRTRSLGDGVNMSNVMLIEQGSLVGYYRDIFVAAVLINTATTQTSSGVTPLIVPITTGKQNKNLSVPLPMLQCTWFLSQSLYLGLTSLCIQIMSSYKSRVHM